MKPTPLRGRGTTANPHNRFAPNHSVAEDDGWYQEVPLTQGTEVRIELAKTIQKVKQALIQTKGH